MSQDFSVNPPPLFGKVSGERIEALLTAAQSQVVDAIVSGPLCRECRGPLGPSRIRYCAKCYDAFMAAHPELSEDA